MVRIKKKFELYFDVSSIGVLQYLSQKSLKKSERFWSNESNLMASIYIFVFRMFWMFCVIVSLLLCGYLVIESSEKFLEKKIVIGLSSKQRHISEIPHPAIALCFEVLRQFDGFNYNNFTENADEASLKSLTDEK